MSDPTPAATPTAVADPTPTATTTATAPAKKTRKTVRTAIALMVVIWMTYLAGYYSWSGSPVHWLTLVTVAAGVAAAVLFWRHRPWLMVVALGVIISSWLIDALGTPSITMDGGPIQWALAIGLLIVFAVGGYAAYRAIKKYL